MAHDQNDPRVWIEKLAVNATLAEGWLGLQAAGNAAVAAVCDGLSHPNPRVR